MTGIYVGHIWVFLTIIRLSGNIEETPVPKLNSNETFLFVTGILTVFLITTFLKYLS